VNAGLATVCIVVCGALKPLNSAKLWPRSIDVENVGGSGVGGARLGNRTRVLEVGAVRRRLQACTAYTGSGFPEFKNAANAAGDKCIDIGPHTITFTETIQHSGLLEVFSSTGNGVISGGDTTRMFIVGSGDTLDLEGLTLSDGNAGIYVSKRAARRAFVS